MDVSRTSFLGASHVYIYIYIVMMLVYECWNDCGKFDITGDCVCHDQALKAVAVGVCSNDAIVRLATRMAASETVS